MDLRLVEAKFLNQTNKTVAICKSANICKCSYDALRTFTEPSAPSIRLALDNSSGLCFEAFEPFRLL